MDQPFLKLRPLGQNAVNLTAECRLMHFAFELPGGPSLEETGGHAITDFELVTAVPIATTSPAPSESGTRPWTGLRSDRPVEGQPGRDN